VITGRIVFAGPYSSPIDRILTFDEIFNIRRKALYRLLAPHNPKADKIV